MKTYEAPINPILKIQWFLGKIFSNFLPLVWKLHNCYCHTPRLHNTLILTIFSPFFYSLAVQLDSFLTEMNDVDLRNWSLFALKVYMYKVVFEEKKSPSTLKSILHVYWFLKFLPTSSFIPASKLIDFSTFVPPPCLF